MLRQKNASVSCVTTSFSLPNKSTSINLQYYTEYLICKHYANTGLTCQYVLLMQTKCSPLFRSRSGLRLKQQIPLSEMWLSASVDGVTPVAVDSSLSFVIGWPMTNLVASFNSAKHRQMWFSKLER